MEHRDLVHARWWLAYPVALFLLFATDYALGFWRPQPVRLPEQFSPAFLALVLSDVPRSQPSILVAGDSVLWGYKIGDRQTAAWILQENHSQSHVLNLAYEGGSTPNSAVILTQVLASGIPLSGAIVNVNSKEFNEADSSYRTLHPSLERLAISHLQRQDRSLLDLHQPNDLNAALNAWVESVWRLYRLRTDIRQGLFGHDDMAGALVALVQRATGTQAAIDAAHQPTPDRFLGTYDLSPIGADNVGMIYYRRLISTLCSRHIAALIFLTPTNHRLLHDYIDSPEYDENLKRLTTVTHCATLHIANFDRAIPPKYFIDNDHLTPGGQQVLSRLIDPYVKEMIQ